MAPGEARDPRCPPGDDPVKGKLLLLAVSLGLALAGAEMALRRAAPEWMIFFPPVCFHPDVFQEAPFGYRLLPSRTIRRAYPPAQPRIVTIRSNADGFRGGRELHEADPRTRIVVLGDSMVFGDGVEEGERFTELIEAAEPGWRVDNLGMIGFGTDLMLRSLEAVGLDPVPRAVVFAVYTDDFRRVAPQYAGAGFPIPRFTLEAGRLVTVPYPEPHLWERSRLFQGILYAVRRYTSATFPLNGAILDRFIALSAERGFRPAVVFLPAARDGADDRRRRTWLADWAARRRVPFRDLTAAVAAGGGPRLYLPDDPHWSPEGHRVVAADLHRFLADEVLGDGLRKPAARD
jgi:GDSL-like lipase/acylhydrolase family protein